MTTVTILSALILFIEEALNWGQTFESFLGVLFAWLLTVMGLLVTFKMMIAVFSIKVILQEINKQVDLLVKGNDISVKLEDLVDVHASLCGLVGETNRIFQPTLMLFHMMNCFNLLAGSYYITLILANLEKSFLGNSDSLLLGTATWVIFSGSSLIFICTECDKTVHEVCKQNS